MRKPFLVLKTGNTFEDVVAKRGDYEDWFLAGLGITPNDARVVDVRKEPAPPVDSVRGVVITGSSAMVTDREPWSEALRPWMLHALEVELPMLAVCYGHQLLVDALGGDVGPNPSGRQIGTVRVELTDEGLADPLLGGLADPHSTGELSALSAPASPLFFQATHRQSARTLPPGIVSLARSPRDPNHAFRAGPRAWAVQFHPEIDHEAIAEYVLRRRDAIRSEGDDPDAILAAIRPSEHGTKLLRRFVELARGQE